MSSVKEQKLHHLKNKGLICLKPCIRYSANLGLISKRFLKKSSERQYLLFLKKLYIHTHLAQTPEIGQGLGRFLRYGACKQEQT